MKRLSHSLTLFASISVVGFAESGCSNIGATTFQSDYETSYRKRAEAFDASGYRIILEDYDGPFEINSCKTLQERAKFKPLDYSSLSSIEISYLIPCMIVKVLDQAALADKSFFPPDDQLGQIVFSNLNLTTFRSSLGPRLPAQNNNNTFAGFFRKEAVVSDHSFTIQTEDWVYELTIDARADFDDDGIEDLLAVFYDNANEASYFSITPLILSRTEPNGEITAQSWDRITR